MKSLKKLLPALLIALALIFSAFYPVVMAAPPTAPLEARVVSFGTTGITQNTTYAGYLWGAGFSEADLFYRIDQGGVNTLTLELEVSPEGVWFYDDIVSPTLVLSNTADSNSFVHDIPVHGVYWRVLAVVATSTAVVTPNGKMTIR